MLSYFSETTPFYGKIIHTKIVIREGVLQLLKIIREGLLQLLEIIRGGLLWNIYIMEMHLNLDLKVSVSVDRRQGQGLGQLWEAIKRKYT